MESDQIEFLAALRQNLVHVIVYRSQTDDRRRGDLHRWIEHRDDLASILGHADELGDSSSARAAPGIKRRTVDPNLVAVVPLLANVRFVPDSPIPYVFTVLL